MSINGSVGYALKVALRIFYTAFNPALTDSTAVPATD